ncbi:MAG: hypothetical protein HXY34_13530 [Candidatus Thorarchaeota archaeon]|nr:hypothetical protein [Candidatus Thorarchaeota archaeon]
MSVHEDQPRNRRVSFIVLLTLLLSPGSILLFSSPSILSPVVMLLLSAVALFFVLFFVRHLRRVRSATRPPSETYPGGYL